MLRWWNLFFSCNLRRKKAPQNHCLKRYRTVPCLPATRNMYIMVFKVTHCRHTNNILVPGRKIRKKFDCPKLFDEVVLVSYNFTIEDYEKKNWFENSPNVAGLHLFSALIRTNRLPCDSLIGVRALNYMFLSTARPPIWPNYNVCLSLTLSIFLTFAYLITIYLFVWNLKR